MGDRLADAVCMALCGEEVVLKMGSRVNLRRTVIVAPWDRVRCKSGAVVFSKEYPADPQPGVHVESLFLPVGDYTACVSSLDGLITTVFSVVPHHGAVVWL